MKAYVNGRIVSSDAASISIYDHGFLYGDGVYETVRLYGERAFDWNSHYRRLKASARTIGLAIPWSSAHLRRLIERLGHVNQASESLVRLTVTRGNGALGLDPALCARPTLVIQLHPARPLDLIWQKGLTAALVPHARPSARSIDPKAKVTSALSLVLARAAASRLKAHEALMTNSNGDLTEGTVSNLFFVEQGVVHTPAVSCGLLEGTTRALVVKLARSIGVRVREGRFQPERLRQAEELFISSAGYEVAAVVRFIDARQKTRHFIVGNGRPGPVTQRLHQVYREWVAKARRAGDR